MIKFIEYGTYVLAFALSFGAGFIIHPLWLAILFLIGVLLLLLGGILLGAILATKLRHDDL